MVKDSMCISATTPLSVHRSTVSEDAGSSAVADTAPCETTPGKGSKANKDP